MLAEAFRHAHCNFPEGGTCLEFGVWTGWSFFWQVDQIINQYPNSKLIGFDSWQGLPPESQGVWSPDRHAAGLYQADKQIILDGLRNRGLANDTRFRLVDGFFSDSLTDSLCAEIQNLIFVNIDVDLYISAKQVLNFVTPLIRKGVVIYFDDWKDPIDKYEGKWGEHLAWEEWTAEHPNFQHEMIATNEYNQRYMEIG